MGMGTPYDGGPGLHPSISDGDHAGEISLVGLKEKARRILPPNSPARNLILAEKDTLPVGEALAKFEVFDRLLMNELKVA